MLCRLYILFCLLCLPAWANLPTLGPLIVERYQPTTELPLGLSLWSGPAPMASALNMVVASEGYTAEELFKFPLDALRLRNVWESIEPYKSRKDDVNWWLLVVPSVESGASHPGAPRNTAFGVTYGYGGIERLMAPNYQARGKVWVAVSNTFPTIFAYGTILLVNDAEYGGGGGWCMVASVHSDSGWIALHEGGHTIVGLEDEYPIASPYFRVSPNVMPVSSPQFSIQIQRGRWKSSDRCLEFKLSHHEFCNVCLEATTDELNRLTKRIQ